MSHTPTLPLDDKRMWRRALARAHPDSGGTHEDFVWLGAVKDTVCNSKPETEPKPWQGYSYSQPGRADQARVPYSEYADFLEVTQAALRRARKDDDYGELLSLLIDCVPLPHLAHEEQRGASYKRLAAIGHTVGMTKAERVAWCRVAESIPLSDRHAGHILSRLKERVA